MKPNKFVILVLFCGVLFGAAGLGRLVVARRAGDAGSFRMPGHMSRIKGNLNAPVRIMEYSDYQCPACAKAEAMIDTFLTKYPGKIALEHRHFPLEMHRFSKRAAIFAECADVQGKFWPYHSVLFRSQQSWMGMDNADRYFTDLAIGLGMNSVLLQACVSNEAVAKKVQVDIDIGQKRGVQSTPTFFVNDKMVVGFLELNKELEKQLK